MKYAPVAMFVYNRADNTKQTLDALLTNTLARETDLFVFSDGGKNEESWQQVNEVRTLLHETRDRVEREGLLHSMTLVERPENIYLERNITEGIVQVFEQHDRIIVLEDDIVTGPYFLQYMNDAFEHYQDNPRVMHVAGFTHLDLQARTDALKDETFYFTQHMSGWGWGTWRDRWQQHFEHYKTRAEALDGLTAKDTDALQYGGVFTCLKSLDKDPIPWDVCWEIGIYRAHGLCLSPGHTLVRNVGLKSGTHFQSWDILQYYEYDREPLCGPLPIYKVEQPEKNPAIEQLFVEAITDWGIRYTWLGKVVRFVYKKVKGKKQ